MTAKSLAVLFLHAVSVVASAAEWVPTRIVAVDYPLLGVQSNTSGVVRLECDLRQDGAVDAVRVLSGPLLLGRHLFERVALWRFRSEGHPASGSRRAVVLTFRFVLGDVAPGPPKSQFVYDYRNEFTVSASRMQRTH